MASIEFINKRIEGKEKELEKLNKKLAERLPNLARIMVTYEE